MQLRTLKCAGIGFGVGIGAGLTMVLLGMEWKDATFGAKTIGPWKLLNIPALQVADWWTGAGLPPTNEAAWVITPAMMVLAQWTLIGLLIGLLWGCSMDGKVEPSSDTAKASPSLPPAK